LLDRFCYISVRENKGIDLLKSIGLKSNIDVMPDPTLLLDKSDWDSIKVIPMIKDKYIFVYLVVNPEALAHIRKYAKKNNLKVIWVNGPNYYYEEDETFIKIKEGIGPREFIGLIENSELNIIDSFHGAVFSIIYNRPFYVYGSLSGDDRKKTLLELSGLTDRCIPYSFDFGKVDLDIDYSSIHSILSENRTRNVEKLKHIIQENIPDDEKMKNTVVSLVPKNECTGCGACAAICPKEAITLKPLKAGFLYPTVDSKKCIECGKCISVCPTNVQFKRSSDTITGYAFSLNNTKELRTCSSGGIATAIAKQALKSSGIVYAVRYSSDCRDICFDRFTDIHDIKHIKGTKYSESLPPDYKSILADLKSGKSVVVIGLPCQIAAIRAYLLPNTYENLMCVSLVCQGKAPLMLYHKLVEKLEKESKSHIQKINMRWKKKDWSCNWLVVKFEDGTIKEEPLDMTPFGMLCHKLLRPSCFNCKFKMDNSQSDIQIGDFWGSEALPETMQNSMGLSCVIGYTEKGNRFLSTISSGVLTECSIEQIVSGNGAIVKSEKMCSNYDKLAAEIEHYKLEMLCDMYLGKQEKLKATARTFIKSHVSSETTAKVRKVMK
ncbi:MAG: 4Fe-4S dicluster domain-containing protein, partial [Crenarchaeota archaeon]|nr:4Fe-4S dicluster domain-containing protein [Thermoproteota archaeon]